MEKTNISTNVTALRLPAPLRPHVRRLDLECLAAVELRLLPRVAPGRRVFGVHEVYVATQLKGTARGGSRYMATPRSDAVQLIATLGVSATANSACQKASAIVASELQGGVATKRRCSLDSGDT